MANLFARLTRGLKLLVEHIFTPISNTLNILTSTGVTTDLYKKKQGTFRITINIPYVNWHSKADDSDRFSTITVPFILPALQEQFTLDNSEIEDYELMEISISHDTRCEAARLSGITHLVGGNPTNEEGAITKGEGNAYTIHLMEKELSPGKDNQAQNEVFKITVPEVALLSDFSRANPYVQTDIAVPLRHDRSYLVEFTPAKDNQPFFSLAISLKLKRKLTTRDSGVSIQNIPLASLGTFSPVPTVPGIPASNDTIKADGATGVFTGFKLIDSIIQRKLSGGYDKAGNVPYAENLLDSAGYDVIAVPLFGSWFVESNTPIVGSPVDDVWTDALSLPWVGGVAAIDTVDRAIIPIQHPMTIHHVVIAANYTHADRATAAKKPSQATFTNEVGVGMLQGIRAEDLSVEQIAYLNWNPTNIHNARIDTMGSGGDLRPALTYNYDLLSCPLVGAGGHGYTAQGTPVFVGKSHGITAVRSNIGTPPHSSITVGGEQALDIRWRISDSGTVPGINGTIIGWPGHWVYIIGKKHLI